MRAADLLDIWDRGRDRHTIDRALVVLAFTCPELDWEALADLPIGERNRRLLATRAASFGPRLDIVSACPACGAQLEFEFEFPLGRYPVAGPRTVALALEDGRALSLRLPDSRDLAAVAGVASPERARALLLRRCLVDAGVAAGADAGSEDGGLWGLDADIPASLVDRVSAVIDEHDPLAAIGFSVDCVECAQSWRATLDPADYLWREIAAQVQVVVREVARLARAYGWTEAEILSMSPARRRLYLEQLGGGRGD